MPRGTINTQKMRLVSSQEEKAVICGISLDEFIGYGMVLRAITLGHSYPPVLESSLPPDASGGQFQPPNAN